MGANDFSLTTYELHCIDFLQWLHTGKCLLWHCWLDNRKGVWASAHKKVTYYKRFCTETDWGRKL